MDSHIEKLKAIYSDIDLAFQQKDLDGIAKYIAPGWTGSHGEANVTRPQLLENVRGQFRDFDDITWPRTLSNARLNGDNLTVRAEGTYRAIKVEGREPVQMELANDDTWLYGPEGWQNIYSKGLEVTQARV